MSGGNNYAEWVKAQSKSYRTTETERIVATSANHEPSPTIKNINAAKWRLATSVVVEMQADCCMLQSELHALEHVPSKCNGKQDEFIPIRFIFNNKLSANDMLLLGFDALLLSHALRHEITVGKIIHGDHSVTLGVRT